MTFRDFRESMIDYGQGYAELLKKHGTMEDEKLKKAIGYCYRMYRICCILRDLRESKLANKPLHYKVVNEFVKGYSDDFMRFYIVTDNNYTSRQSRIMSAMYRTHDSYESFYLRTASDNTNTADWEAMDEMIVDIVNPADILEIYTRQKERNEKLQREIGRLQCEYEAARKNEPHLVRALYIRIQ